MFKIITRFNTNIIINSPSLNTAVHHDVTAKCPSCKSYIPGKYSSRCYMCGQVFPRPTQLIRSVKERFNFHIDDKYITKNELIADLKSLKGIQ